MSNGAATLHRLTKHGSSPGAEDGDRLVSFEPLDPHNRPAPFKRYMGREPAALTREFGFSSASAVDRLSGTEREWRTRPEGTGSPKRSIEGGEADAVEASWDETRLARSLFLSSGVSRVARSALDEMTYFRTAMSAGNLHPVEVYVVCGNLGRVGAGVHHFAPLEFGLTELRRGDHRRVLAEAANESAIAESAVTLVLTGIPWRTAWKYGERGFRHLYWDAGALLANLLAVEPATVVRIGFVDDRVATLVGVDGVSEFPLALATLPGPPVGSDEFVPDAKIETLDVRAAPISHAPLEFPLITAAQHDGDLKDRAAVDTWRSAAGTLGSATAERTEPPGDVPRESIDALILRRGSTRLMRRETARRELLTWALSAAARGFGDDFAREGGTLLDHFVTVHDVTGIPAGAYRWHRDRLELRAEGQYRDIAARLCLGQPLGGDSAYTTFHATDLGEALGVLGSRGYRAAQLEAGVAAGRLALASFTLGYGATGLTFYDDAVSRFFATSASCMLVTAVGIPDYRNATGGLPGKPTALSRYGELMMRLNAKLQ